MENNIDVAYSTFGGHLEDIPLPHKRKFPSDEEKRNVDVQITKYYGIGIHYYVHLKEEENPILDISNKDKPTWRKAWDDDEAEGRMFSGRFNISKEVDEFIKETQKKEFPKETHTLYFSDPVHKRWFYKDGD